MTDSDPKSPASAPQVQGPSAAQGPGEGSVSSSAQSPGGPGGSGEQREPGEEIANTPPESETSEYSESDREDGAGEAGRVRKLEQLDLSIVVPIMDEEESLPRLYSELTEALVGTGLRYEIVLVDDRSMDNSREVMVGFWRRDPRVRLIFFRRNFGQTAAMAAGFDHSRGEVVVTLDGDLQNDPADIPKLLEELHKGHDVVAGWRRQRHDGLVLRKLPSRVANRLINFLTGTQIHDTGCTLKAFRRKLIKNLPIYAEQHRFLPAISQTSGARVSEVVVNHRARQFGKSKYGLGRAVRVFLDLFVIKMIAQFAHHPLHYFGLFSLPFAGLGALILVLGTIEWDESFRLTDSWPQFVVFIALQFFLLIVYFVMLGLLSEVAVYASGMHRRRVLDRTMNEVQ